jgi:sugar phosphate isomerase/epimerase
MKKSIGDNLFPKSWALEQGLALIKKSGFDGVELWLGDKPWFQMNTSDADGRKYFGARSTHSREGCAPCRAPD